MPTKQVIQGPDSQSMLKDILKISENIKERHKFELETFTNQVKELRK